MRRRHLIAALGGIAAFRPLATRSQQPVARVIGFLTVASPDSNPTYVGALRRGLAENGFVEGRNLHIEYRWAEGHLDRLPALAADLVGRHVEVIVTGGGAASALAAKGATTTIPIVFGSGDDPVKYGLVSSFSRPGGNLTGTNPMIVTLDPKRLALLHQMVPGAGVVAMLFNPGAPSYADVQSDVAAAAQKLGLRLEPIGAGDAAEFDAAFERFARQGATALLVAPDPLFNFNRARVVALAAKYALPAIYELRDYAVSGGLMSYGTDLPEMYHVQGTYVARILNGEKPGDLPVVQPTKFELVINRKTAAALGLAIPPNLLALADEVID